ncbi:MAG: apolipoprotein N-acyltransferase [Candidatus Rokubacteria bacterium]|nr:apolipoprotein N-acyltransferase [Candidatus Rokubacteria bacterium]
MTASRRRLLRGTAVVAGGLALAQAYPPLEWDWLAWLSLAPLFLVALAAPPRAALGWGSLGGLAFFLVLLRWLNFTFQTYSAIPWMLAWGPTALLAGYCGLWFGLVTWLVALVARRRGPGLALAVVPFAWVAAEWGRGLVLGGFPWGLLGYSQYARLPFIQIAELGGVWAVSFVIVAVNAALAGAIALPRRRSVVGVAIALALVGGTVAFGVARLGELTAAEPGERARGATVAIMQPAIAQPLKWDEQHAAETLRVYFGLTRQLRPGDADLVVWPETATPTVLRRDPVLGAALVGLSREVGAPLLVGSIDFPDPRVPLPRNTAFFLDERGIQGRYDKIQLVPFGEFVPLPGIIGFVRGWAEFIADMEAGTAHVVFRGPPAPLGVVICYEGIFPGLVREFVKGGARLMVNMTNDAWFGMTSGPEQHLSMYTLRAVEHRTAVVRAANTGVSAFIVPTGRILRRLGLFDRGLMVERVPLRSRTTAYTRFGDWLPYLGLLVSGAALAAAALPARA